MSDAVKIAAAKRLRKDCAELRELATNPPGTVPPIVTSRRRPTPKTPRRPAPKPPTKAAQKLAASRCIPIEAIEPGPKGQVTAVEVRAYINEHNGDLPTAEAVKAAQAEVKAKKPRAGYVTAFVSGKAWRHLEKRLSTLARDATIQARIIMGTDFNPKIYSSLPPRPLTEARPDLVGPFSDAKRRKKRRGVLRYWARSMANGHCPTCGKELPKPREDYLACAKCRKVKDLDAIVETIIDNEEYNVTDHGDELFCQPQWPGVVLLPDSPFEQLQPCVSVTDDFMARLEALEGVAKSFLAAHATPKGKKRHRKRPNKDDDPADRWVTYDKAGELLAKTDKNGQPVPLGRSRISQLCSEGRLKSEWKILDGKKRKAVSEMSIYLLRAERSMPTGPRGRYALDEICRELAELPEGSAVSDTYLRQVHGDITDGAYTVVELANFVEYCRDHPKRPHRPQDLREQVPLLMHATAMNKHAAPRK